MAVGRHLPEFVLAQFDIDEARVEADFNSAFLQSHQPIGGDGPIVLAKPAPGGAMRVQHLNVELRAMEINGVVHYRASLAVREGAFGIRQRPTPNDLLPVRWQPQPMRFCSSDLSANFARE